MIAEDGLYGVLTALWDRNSLLCLTEGRTAPNARTAAVLSLLRELIPQITGGQRGLLFLQYDDFIHSDLRSLAFGRRRGEAPGVVLIPDTFFLESGGYRTLRESVEAERLPSWSKRQDRLFWRGAATTNGWTAKGTRVEKLAEVPRVALCLRMRAHPAADVAICAPWGFEFPAEAAIAWMRSRRIFRPPVQPVEQANYRYLLDIDGVANAWGFFEKLLLGSCILKVETTYEQWFYSRLEPWVHYVPVGIDHSDLLARLAWCRAHPREAQAIGRAGQAFALGLTLADGRAEIHNAVQRCFTPI